MTEYQCNEFRYTIIYKDCHVEFGYAPSIMDLIEVLENDGRLDMVGQLHMDMVTEE